MALEISFLIIHIPKMGVVCENKEINLTIMKHCMPL